MTEKKRFRIENGRISTTPYQTDTYDYEAGSGQNGAWKDQLKSYNGQTIEYDGAGNPTSYLGKALTWKGRKLMGIAGLGMEYDYKGYRIKKGNKRYIWQEDRLIAEVEADEGEESFIYYNYDESGVSGMNVNGSEYYYRKNLQGDVIAVYDDNGHMECRYDYDAWGRHRCRLENGTVIYDSATGPVSGYENHIGIRNAIRYRSYYWDSETGLYYLQSRYYDPEIGRFISPDDIKYLEPESIGGLNLYAYCFDNPVLYADLSGHFAISLLVGLAVSFVIGTAASAISQYVQYEGEVNWLQAGIDGLFAVASTALAYTGIGLIGSIVAGAGLGLAQYTLDSAVFHDDFTWSGALIATGLGALGGLASGRGAQHFKSIGSNLDETGRTGIKAIITAFDRYGKGAGYQRVMNLWGDRVANSIAKSISQNFTKSALIIWGTIVASYKASYWLNKINGGF